MAVPIQQFLMQAIDSNGPMNGGLLHTYQAGTTTDLNTYTTAAADTVNANPVVLNSRGEPTGVFLIPGDSYSFVLKDANSVTIWTHDNIHVPGDCGFAVDTGSADTYTATYGNDPAVLVDGQTGILRIVNTNAGASTFSPNGLTAKSWVTTDGTALVANQLVAAMYAEWIYDGNGDQYILVNPAFEVGTAVQIVSSVDGAVATGTTALPFDDTIPQNTDGDQYLSQVITPTDTNNKLIIEARLLLANSAGANAMSVALIQDSTANALTSTIESIGAANQIAVLEINHEMAAGTTSATTFKVRAGGNAGGTNTFNGSGAARKHGGVLNSFIRITEIAQ